MRELTLPAPLLLLPGLGADGDLFTAQRQGLGDAVSTPAWIAPRDPREGLSDYAARWAERINPAVAEFGSDRPWFLGGMSMGGMIALEMVPHLERTPAAVLLISSCRSDAALPKLIKIAGALTAKAPARFVAMGVKLGAIPFGVRDGADDDGTKLLVRMARSTDPDHLKWAIGATGEWTYPGPPESFTRNGEAIDFPPVLQVHGRDDWLIPCREDDCDRVVEHGRHLINLSHHHTVNRWLYDHVTRLCGIDESKEPRIEDPDSTVMRRPELAARY
ncbi:MAG: alpha/beta hydrolase [Planctomycetota bacterium]